MQFIFKVSNKNDITLNIDENKHLKDIVTDLIQQLYDNRIYVEALTQKGHLLKISNELRPARTYYYIQDRVVRFQTYCYDSNTDENVLSNISLLKLNISVDILNYIDVNNTKRILNTVFIKLDQNISDEVISLFDFIAIAEMSHESSSNETFQNTLMKNIYMNYNNINVSIVKTIRKSDNACLQIDINITE